MDQIISAGIPHPEISAADFASYLPLFDEEDDISEADKLALLQALWSIALSYAQIGWGVNAVQQAENARALDQITGGKLGEDGARCTIGSHPMVNCPDQHIIETFNSAARDAPQEEKES
jgi:hypothetical protein